MSTKFDDELRITRAAGAFHAYFPSMELYYAPGYCEPQPGPPGVAGILTAKEAVEEARLVFRRDGVTGIGYSDTNSPTG